jgi:hypothetical protein
MTNLSYVALGLEPTVIGFEGIIGVHSGVGLWCQAVEMVGSQGLPVRALWMAWMGRRLWLRVLVR